MSLHYIYFGPPLLIHTGRRLGTPSPSFVGTWPSTSPPFNQPWFIATNIHYPWLAIRTISIGPFPWFFFWPTMKMPNEFHQFLLLDNYSTGQHRAAPGFPKGAAGPC